MFKAQAKYAADDKQNSQASNIVPQTHADYDKNINRLGR